MAYLARASTIGVDVLYVVTGSRLPTSFDMLTEFEGQMVLHLGAFPMKLIETPSCGTCTHCLNPSITLVRENR